MAEENALSWDVGENPLQIGMLLYPGLTLLDLAGPANVLGLHGKIHLIWKNMEPVWTDMGISINPTATFNDVPEILDVLFVPGGFGTNEMLEDREVLDFLARAGATARYVTSVCTGSAILAAAGLMEGHSAACHWAYYEPLEALGVKPNHDRVCVDGNRISGGGVTAGVDFGLTLLAELKGQDVAEFTQLALEYDPQPPFNAGHPRVARPELVEMITGADGIMGAMNLAAVQIAKARREHLNEVLAAPDRLSSLPQAAV